MKPSLEILYQAWAEEPRGEASQAREKLEVALRDDEMLYALYRYEEQIMKLAFEAGFMTARELMK